MDKRFYNRGFSLVSLIILMSILTLVYVLIFYRYKKIDHKELIFYDSYVYNQSRAMANREDINLDLDYENIERYTDIRFNQKGNVNMAQTVILNNKKYTIGLGLGKIIYEKGLYRN